MSRDLANFLAIVFLLALGTAWVLAVSPLLIGVPVTWANAPLLLTTAPGFACYFIAIWRSTRLA